jgi:hypothetical protein
MTYLERALGLAEGMLDDAPEPGGRSGRRRRGRGCRRTASGWGRCAPTRPSLTARGVGPMLGALPAAVAVAPMQARQIGEDVLLSAYVHEP